MRNSFPTVKDENFRYIGLKDIAWKETAEVQMNRAQSVVLVKKQTDVRVVKFSELNKLPEKTAKELEKIIKEIPEKLEKDFFAELTHLRAQDGYVIYVPKNYQMEDPVESVVAFQEELEILSYRTILYVEENASINFIEDLTSKNGAFLKATTKPLVTGLTQVIAKKNSKIQYEFVCGLSENTQGFIRQTVSCDEGAKVEYTPLFAGGSKVQLRVDAECLGKDSEFHSKGAVRGSGTELYDFWINVYHPAPHTKSSLEFWSAMGAESRAIFNGKILIPPTGKFVESFQKNRNLLLSKKAQVQTIPKLEIAVDEVKCAHGASVSSVSEDQLYYLQCRGISKEDAEEMIVRGFIEPVVEKIPSEMIRERVLKLLHSKGRALEV